MPPGTWQHWRVLVADRNAMEKVVEFGENCEVVLLARDGVWRTTAPKALPSQGISLTGASRADFAVRCSANTQLKVAGTVVAEINVEGSSDPAVHPLRPRTARRCGQPTGLHTCEILRGESNVNFEAVTMGARTISGSKFDADVPTFSLPADSVQEWSVNGAARHPFHLHVYHVQKLGSNGDFEDGEYYDVVSSNGDLRFDLNAATSSPYAGRTIMHCHIHGS